MHNERESSAPVVMMCCLAGMCVVVISLFFIAEPAGGHGIQHARFPSTMYAGDIGMDRLGGVRWLGLGFVLLQALFFVTSLLLGTRQRGALRIWLALGGLLYLAAFVALVVAESIYVQGGARDIVLGLPVPTAIMIYAVGGVPVLFSLVYIRYFDRWILKPDDLQRINALAEQQRQARAEETH